MRTVYPRFAAPTKFWCWSTAKSSSAELMPSCLRSAAAIALCTTSSTNWNPIASSTRARTSRLSFRRRRCRSRGARIARCSHTLNKSAIGSQQSAISIANRHSQSAISNRQNQPSAVSIIIRYMQFIYTMKGLGKVHPPDHVVLKDIGLSFFPGAKIGVLGLNGSGKSTLLRIMAGEDQRFVGEAWPADGISIGFLPQEPQLDASKTVLGNVEEGVA